MHLVLGDGGFPLFLITLMAACEANRTTIYAPKTPRFLEKPGKLLVNSPVAPKKINWLAGSFFREGSREMIHYMGRNVVAFIALGLIVGCGGQAGKQSSDPNPKSNAKPTSNDAGKKPTTSQEPVSDADQKEEKRRTISFSKRRLTIKGVPVEVGKTSSADLEKIIGPPDRVVDLEGIPNLIALWDKQGLRAYYYPKKVGKVVYFDCIFVVETDLETEPQSAFSDDFGLEGTQLSNATTKETLQAKISDKLRDHSFNLPGFSATYTHHDISFEKTKDRKGLASVRISPPLPGRK